MPSSSRPTRTRRSAKSWLRSWYVALLDYAGLLRWAKKKVARRGTVVLTFHRVLPDDEFVKANCQAGMKVCATTFAALSEYIQGQCHGVTIEEAATFRQNGAVPKIAMTFDDGWRDNFKTAYPQAKRHQIPSTIFICPELIRSQRAMWPERLVELWRHAQSSGTTSVIRQIITGSLGPPAGRASLDGVVEILKSKPTHQREELLAKLQTALNPNAGSPEGEFLRWEDVQEMSREGVIFGSHTQTHQVLTALPEEEVDRELSESKREIAASLGNCDLLAYPNGDWSPGLRSQVKARGFRYAFANNPGTWSKDTDPLAIPRVNIWEGKLVGSDGKFSPREFEYSVFWKAYRAENRFRP